MFGGRKNSLKSRSSYLRLSNKKEIIFGVPRSTLLRLSNYF
jgi:hypothetical protein